MRRIPTGKLCSNLRWGFLIILMLLVNSACAQSDRPGMGSTIYDGGVTFRVWAPHADSVYVAGDFNNWSHDATPLALESPETGIWSNDVPGAQVGQTYRYVINRNGQPTVTRRDPYSRVVTDSDYNTGNTIIYDTRAFQWHRVPFHRPAKNDLVIYEMHIGTFVDKPGGNPGTFTTAIKGLPAVASLGFNAVEVLPINEFIGKFSSGYNPADQLAIENKGYGGPDAFKVFVRACHDHGLAVIVDIVHNHWGPWDVATHQFDGWSTNDWPGGIYFYDANRINSPWGPRPNYSDPMVRQYIFDQLRMWVTEYRVDGFRWDSTSNVYNTNNGTGTDLPDGWSLLQQASTALKDQVPGFINIAEDLRNDSRLTDSVADGGAGFDAQWHFFAGTIRNELQKTNDANISMGNIKYVVVSTFNNDFLQRVIYTESHNEICCGNDRLTVLIDPNDPTSWLARKKSTLGAALMFCSPGIPMIFQGQEFLEKKGFDEHDPIDWRMARQFPGVRRMYGDMVKERRNLAGDTPGLEGDSLNVYQVDQTDKLMVFDRFDSQANPPGSTDTIVVANFTGQPRQQVQIGLPYSGTWITRFNSDDQMYSDDFAGVGSVSVDAVNTPFGGMPFSGQIDIGAYSLMVLSR